MSRAEAIVVLQRLQDVIADLRDLNHDAPLHVVVNRNASIEAIQEASQALREQFGVTV